MVFYGFVFKSILRKIVILYMPILIRKVRNKDCWRVYNTQSGQIHAYCTTLAKAKAQKRLLDSLENNLR
jgi:hypothetical protein